jgi:hypothetical protein
VAVDLVLESMYLFVEMPGTPIRAQDDVPAMVDVPVQPGEPLRTPLVQVCLTPLGKCMVGLPGLGFTFAKMNGPSRVTP